MEERTVRVAGRRVGMFAAGEGAPVVLLHGLLGSPYYFLPLARLLAARGRRVVVPWLPGHGPSDELSPFTFAAAAELLAGAAAAAGAERPALVGHSFGAPLAVTWAAGGEVASLAAASPVGVAPLRLGLVATRLLPIGRVVAAASRLGAQPLAMTSAGRRLVFGWFVGMADPRAVEPRMARRIISAAATAEPALASIMPPLLELDVTPDARRVTCPSLVVWGSLDRDGIQNGPGLAAALRGDRRVLPGIGHMPMLEAPFGFRVALDGFV